MVSAGDFRNGLTIEIDGTVYQVIEFQHVKPGKGAAFVRTKLKNVVDGGVVEKTFRPTEKYPQAHIDKKEMQYLYNDGEMYNFMDNETYEQIALTEEAVGDSMKFVKENDNVKMVSYKGNIFAIEPPMFAELEVTETEPGVKGDTANIKNRQPIGKMFVKGASDLPEFYQDIVTDELNVKEIELTDDVRAFTSYTFKPQLKTVGPKYGKLLGGIKNELSNLDGNAAMDELNATGVLKLQVNGQEIELAKEDLLIDMAQMEGYVSESDYGITVVLDTNLTEELLTEGFVREIISKIQTMRKEAGFEVMDKIKVTYDGSEKAEKVFAEYAEQIGQETLAVAVEKAEPAGYVKDWKINGEAVNMGVEKQGE